MNGHLTRHVGVKGGWFTCITIGHESSHWYLGKHRKLEVNLENKNLIQLLEVWSQTTNTKDFYNESNIMIHQ